MSPPTRPGDAWNIEKMPLVREDSQIPFLYYVESSSGDQEHTVDLTDRGGLGSCTCKNFQVEANFNFKKTGVHIPWGPKRVGKTDCRHLFSCKEHFYVTVTVPLLKAMANGIPKS